MKTGLLMFSTDYAIHPAELARAAEERGFESLLFPEHTHIPTSRRTPWPGGATLPKEYSHTNDLFVALSFAAAATSKLKIGTGICLVVEHDPITLAKQVATLDSLSGGRLLFGIGGGWNREEMENHGTDFTTRWAILTERVAAMKAIWTSDEASFHGRHVDFDPIWSWPKPVQKPHPPILLGSGSARGRQRVVDFCDGWMPIAGRDDVLGGIDDLRARAGDDLDHHLQRADEARGARRVPPAGRRPRSVRAAAAGPRCGAAGDGSPRDPGALARRRRSLLIGA
jgi:probable F420-dependent oxidoreductase